MLFDEHSGKQAKVAAEGAGVLGGDGAFAAQDHRPEGAMRTQQARKVGGTQPVLGEQMLQHLQRSALRRGGGLVVFDECAKQVEIIGLVAVMRFSKPANAPAISSVLS